MIPVSIAGHLKIAGRVFVVESLISKETVEIPAFCNSPEYSLMHWYVLKSSTFRSFEKFPFNWSCILKVYRLQYN